jgi:hypothetical protein
MVNMGDDCDITQHAGPLKRRLRTGFYIGFYRLPATKQSDKSATK